MEAYGLFVTQVCRDNNMKYYYGPKIITYTGCVLFWLIITAQRQLIKSEAEEHANQ